MIIVALEKAQSGVSCDNSCHENVLKCHAVTNAALHDQVNAIGLCSISSSSDPIVRQLFYMTTVAKK